MYRGHPRIELVLLRVWCGGPSTWAWGVLQLFWRCVLPLPGVVPAGQRDDVRVCMVDTRQAPGTVADLLPSSTLSCPGH